MLAVRSAWDPETRMNPGKLVPVRVCMETRTRPPGAGGAEREPVANVEPLLGAERTGQQAPAPGAPPFPGRPSRVTKASSPSCCGSPRATAWS